MEKLYQDYAWNLSQAAEWFKLIDNPKYPKAQIYHHGHLVAAQNINQRFKQIYSNKKRAE